MPNITIEYDKETLREFCRRWNIIEFSLFGSAVRDDFGPESEACDARSRRAVVVVELAPNAEGTGETLPTPR
ncbi:MAG: nucleotidyltransferase domain-containing protein [Thermoanaerobaculia bacterium]